ncbi:(2Fe-2S)-binding protein [Epibacterium ulvae]|uniref:(2Fe-2S)-binding protein n=1 Tax=Epibacterium ulvae TaxID=1156985 RepID=UPI00249053D5|nr:(2Fe-2S)-binding protein [Epibacterium ulvae]
MSGFPGVAQSGNAEGVRFKTKSAREIRAETVLLHDGIIPNVNHGSAAGLALKRDTAQDNWYPQSNDAIQVAGDARGILGAKAAHLNGIAAAHRIMGQNVPLDVMGKLEKERKFRTFIDQIYPPLGNGALADEEMIICRCESVRKAQIQTAVENIGTDPNRLKTSLRCGTGPCQGRMCALSVERIISENFRCRCF